LDYIKACDQQFTLTTKKSLHITFKVKGLGHRGQTNKKVWHLFESRPLRHSPRASTPVEKSAHAV